MGGDGLHGRRGYPAPPEVFPEPVAQLRRTVLYTAPQFETDTADGLPADLYCELCLGVLPGEGYPLLGVLVGVGMGEAVSHPPPHLVVVSVTDQR